MEDRIENEIILAKILSVAGKVGGNMDFTRWYDKAKFLCISVFMSERVALSLSVSHSGAFCVCVCVYVRHMPHITDAFYLSLYMSGYNSMAIAMQLSASSSDEQCHILQLWHDVTEGYICLCTNPNPSFDHSNEALFTKLKT